MKIFSKIMIGVVLIAVFGGGGAIYYKSHSGTEPAGRLHTAAVKRGDLASTISATGTLQAEEVVNVGSQVSGRIVGFGPDRGHPNALVDYECAVEKGDLLAKIDPVTYEISLKQAEAAFKQSHANLLQYRAKLKQAASELQRAKSLVPQNAIAATDYDTALYNHESAEANVALGEATVLQNEAAVKLAKVNLGYCDITSPVSGTIIDRRVNIGQTVAASLSAPSLFLIAKDLTKMQVWASVNEADIGRIRGRSGVAVRFTVDAYPDETFHGKVIQVRQNAQMTQNVVTYMVIVATDNSRGKLLPYLTANVQFEVDKKSNVLLVPNAALRWEPDAEQIDSSVDQAALAAQPAKAQERGRIWVVTRGSSVRPVEVNIGLTDGTTAEISGDGVTEGLQVVVGESTTEGTEGRDGEAAASDDDAKNPFIPKPPKGSRPPPGPM